MWWAICISLRNSRLCLTFNWYWKRTELNQISFNFLRSPFGLMWSKHLLVSYGLCLMFYTISHMFLHSNAVCYQDQYDLCQEFYNDGSYPKSCFIFHHPCWSICWWQFSVILVIVILSAHMSETPHPSPSELQKPVRWEVNF